MINKKDVQNIINNKISENVICYAHEFRPSVIAEGIRKIANITENYGYVLIGVSIAGEKYVVNGLSKGFNITDIVSKSLNELTIFPNVESEGIDLNGQYIYVIKVHKVFGGTALINYKLQDESITSFIRNLYDVCVKLQSNAMYMDASEDERNDYIRDMIEQKGEYHVKDQTRRGLSATGKSSGENDIFITKKGMPFTIIEALNLNSLDKTYLSLHLSKIYAYDTTGNLFNVCLVYVEAKDFASFWERYCEYVKNYEYPYRIIDFDENVGNEYSGSEIKIMTTTHNRTGQKTLLYHICVKILSK